MGKYDGIDFTPPSGVRSECRRGVEWVEAGEGGDGLQPETVAWARRLAEGDDISPEKARKMSAWLARHEVDKEGEGFRPGEPGYPSPGRVAWALWGGDPAVGWSAKLVRQMDAIDNEGKGMGRTDTGIIRREFSRAEVREVDGAKRVSFVASTADVDRYGDIVDQRTWRLDHYRANPVIQVDHDYSTAATVARGRVEVRDGALMLEVERWASTGRAAEVRQQVEDGVLSAVSVGFRPGRMIPRSQLAKDDPFYEAASNGYVYYDAELLEVSIVAIPANPYALAAGVQAGEVTGRITQDAVAEAVALALTMDPAYRRRMASLLLTEPETTPSPLPWMR